MAHCTFDTDHYLHIVKSFLDADYDFRTFCDYHPGENGQIILRHDIDIAMEDAERVAEIDASLGIGASYHFLLTSEVYNPQSSSGQRILARIRGLGHRIGLHVDPSNLPRQSDAAASALGQLFAQASTVLGELDAYSLHRPATYGELDGLIEDGLGISLPPSADALRRDMIYRSDSRRVWRQGCVCQEIPSFEGASVQLLMHPIWWTSQGLDREATLARQLEANIRRMDDYLASNLSFYTAMRRCDGPDVEID